MGIPVSEIGTEKPLDFHSFSKQKMTYSPAWKTMSLDARELRYDEYLKQFSRKPKAPTSSQPMDFEAFAASRKKYNQLWVRLTDAERSAEYDKYLRTFSKASLQKRAKRVAQADAKETQKRAVKEVLTEPIDLLVAARIAREVIKDFDYDEAAELAVFFGSEDEALEAVRISHDQLNAKYVAAIKKWLGDNLPASNGKISDAVLQSSTKKSMELGLTAVVKKLGWEAHLPSSVDRSSADRKKGALPRQIAKSRSWKEIEEDSKK